VAGAPLLGDVALPGHCCGGPWLSRVGVGASKGAAWGSSAGVAVGQHMLSTEGEMKKKWREGVRGYAWGLLGPGQ